jgi:cation-transporting ATPase E
MYIILGTQNGPIRMSYPFSAKNLYLIEWFAIGIPSIFLAVQPNREIVKGRFLSNVIKSIVPGAMTVVILHFILNIIRTLPGFEELHANNEVFTTILTVVTTAVMIAVLFQVSQPFNWFRKTVFVLMIISCFLVGMNILPITNMDLSYRRGVEDYDYVLAVDDSVEWILNGENTNIDAVRRPDVINYDEENYVAPVITIDEHNRWCLNGIPTTLAANPNSKFELRVVKGFWSLNDNITKAKAYHQPGLQFLASDAYKRPVLTIDKHGNWCLDGISTGIIVTGFEENLTLNVENNGYWFINNVNTRIKAKEIIIEEEYVIPAVSIITLDNNRVFALDGKPTNVSADYGAEVSLLVDEFGYWLINGTETQVKAEKNGEKIVSDGFVLPTVDIDGFGYFTINNISTNIPAEDNLMITEILISLLLVMLINPLMFLISQILKKLRLAN